MFVLVVEEKPSLIKKNGLSYVDFEFFQKSIQFECACRESFSFIHVTIRLAFRFDGVIGTFFLVFLVSGKLGKATFIFFFLSDFRHN